MADWMPKRALMVLLNLLRAGLVLTLVWYDFSLTVVFIVTLGIWSIHQVYSPAESAMLGELVAPARLASATSLFNLALLLAQLFGLVLLAPLMLKFAEPEALFGICSLLFGAAALTVLRIGKLPDREHVSHGSPKEEIPGVLRAGWKMIARDRHAYDALVDSVLLGIGLSVLVVIVPQYLEQVLDTSANNTVFVFAPAALGLVIGLQIAPIAGRVVGYGRIATLGLLLFILSIAAMGAINQIVDLFEEYGILVSWLEDQFGLAPRVSATMIVSVPAGFASALVSVSARTVMQSATPPQSWARVFATQSSLSNLGALVPTLLVGILIDAVGVQPVTMIVAILLVVGLITGRRLGNREVELHRSPQAT